MQSRKVLFLILALVVIAGGVLFFVFKNSSKEANGKQDLKSEVLLAPSIKWLKKTVPELPMPKGKVVYVSDVEKLYAAVAEAKPNTTIVIKKGTYFLSDSINLKKKGLTLRGESNDRSKVVLRGMGFDNENIGPTQGINICGGPNITVANMTLTEFNIHALAVQGWDDPTPDGLHVYNVAFINNGRQNFKTNGGSIDRPAPKNGIVEYCYFEQTKQIPLGRNDSKGGDYTGGIDCHKVQDWIIRDNVFVNIHGAKGGADAGIFIWNHSSGTIIERNITIGCDKGIAAGNPGVATNFLDYPEKERYHHKGGIIRNNFVYAPNDKVGIEAFQAPGLKIYNNTVVSESGVNRAIQYGHDVSGLEIVNNVVAGGITQIIEATGEVQQSSNITGASLDWFKDASKGNLQLTAAGKKAVKIGDKFKEIKDDFFGITRNSKKIDQGAQQFSK